MTTFNSLPRLVHSTPVVSKVVDKMADVFAQWLDKRKCVIVSNRLVGEISGIPWHASSNAAERDFVDVWKDLPHGGTSDLLAGMTGVRDLWRHRGLFTFTLRIGNWEFMWESSQKMAAQRRRVARKRVRIEKRLAEEEAESTREELRPASRSHQSVAGNEVA